MKSLDQWLTEIGKENPGGWEGRLSTLKKVAVRLKLLPPAYTVIMVAGTNGKGSTSSLLELTYRLAGYRTALFTSPHLLKFNERIAIQGEIAANQEIIEAFETINAVRGKETLSYFEYSLLAALLIYRDIGVLS